MKRIIILFSWIACCTLNAQQSKLDSLFNVVKKMGKEVHISTINELLKVQTNLNPFKADSLAKQYSNLASFSPELALKSTYYLNWADALNRIRKPSQVREKSEIVISLDQEGTLRDKSLAGLAYLRYGQSFQTERKYDSTELYYQKAFDYYTLANDLDGLGYINDRMGVNFWYMQRYPEALEHYKESIRIRKTLDDTTQIQYSYANIGLLYKTIGEYDMALDYFLKALEIKEKIGVKGASRRTLNNIGNLYKDLGDYDLAIAAHEKSLEMKKELFDTLGWSLSLDNIGAVKQVQGNFGEAIDYHLEALQLKRKIGGRNMVYTTLVNIGICYKAINRWHMARKYYEESLQEAQAANDLRGIARAYNNLNALAIAERDFEIALDYGLKSLQTSKDLGTRESLFESHGFLVRNYRLLGDLKKAFYHLDEHEIYEREILDAQKQADLNKLRIRYEFNQKEQELLASNKEVERAAKESRLYRSKQTILFILLLALLFLLLILLLWFKSRLSKNRLERKLLEQESANSFLSKEQLSKDLEIKDLKLLHYTNELKQQKEVIEGYKEQMISLDKSDRTTEKQQLSHIAATIDGRAGQNLSWEDFRLKFDEVHQNFVSHLVDKFGSLTAAELDLLILLKINLSYKDASQILSISHDSVKKSVHRLYKKLQFGSAEEMRVYILQN